MIQLRRPEAKDKEQVLSLMAEFEVDQASHDGGFWDKSNFDYDRWLTNNLMSEAGIDLPDGWVPSIQLVSFDEKNRAIGFLNLRLRLNDYLKRQGGHIGYCIRPSMRGKGFAKEQLRLGLDWAKSKNITSLLVTCHQTNVASRAVILANGGIFEDCQDGIERYWIEVGYE